MADVNAAVDYVLRFEDASLSGTVTETADGKRTRFGIDEHFHPELTNCLFYTSMGSVAALAVARGIYERQYADALCIPDIQNENVAKKLLSLGVNIGTVPAAKMLQEALHVTGDGRIGPLTLDALDRADPTMILDQLKAQAVWYYEHLIARNPALAKYREGWLRRANS